MKVIITGSHFSPAHAVIQKAKWDIVYVGRRFALDDKSKESLEYTICKKEKISFIEIDVPRFSRVKSVKSFPIVRLFQSIRYAGSIIRDVRPDVVVSFGGYVSLPVVIAARFRNVPILIHEQTLRAGLANRVAGKFVDRICISFSSSRKYFKKQKTILTGNPVREEITRNTAKPLVSTKRKILYVTGGSIGSMAINSLISEILPSLTKDYFVVHQVGLSDVEYKGIDPAQYLKKDYFTPVEVSWLFHNASCVVARSGINTVTEVLSTGVPAIFIPLPYGQKDEQLKNAKYAERFRFATYILQEKATASILEKKIRDMIKKTPRYRVSEEELLVHTKATEKIIYEAEKLYKKKERTPQ